MTGAGWALFDAVPPEYVQRVLSVARVRKFDRGEVVFHRGDPAETLHLISGGHFAVRAATATGDTAVLAILGSGEFFGEMALVDAHARRSATVAALEPARTLSVHRIDFEALCRDHPQVSEVLTAVLAAQVRRLTEHLIDALYVPADRRVLRRLHELVGLYAGDREGGPVDIPLTQEDIADMAGTSRATVNRVLRAAEDRAVLALRRGRTSVLDRTELARLAGVERERL